MLLTVKKQVEETVEVKTPAYYKDSIGNPTYINESGQLITIRKNMVNMWDPKDGKVYTEAVEEMWKGKPCTKEEFYKAYAEVIVNLNAAVGLMEINS
jgi:hypothetical protein